MNKEQDTHFYIGDVKITSPVGLAPMAGVTDKPYRLICKKMGAGFLVTELISAKAVIYENKNTNLLFDVDKKEEPIGLQLFGNDEEVIAEAIRRLDHLPFSFVDLNMGCPVPKVVNNGEGSALMKEPKLAAKIVKAMVGATKKPITVKIRLGFDEDNLNAKEVAKHLEDAGASMIAVHGRTRKQMYSGVARYDIIKTVKEALSIPVIANGDVSDFSSLYKILDETGCDGVFVGRAARGNPWIFKELNFAFEKYVKGSKMTKEEAALFQPAIEERKEMMIYHLKELVKQKGEYIAVREMRKHYGWYTAGIKNATSIRREINSVTTEKDLISLLNIL